MGQHAAGFPQPAFRADPNLVVLQGQDSEDEVAVRKVREHCAAFCKHEKEANVSYPANISTKTRMRHTEFEIYSIVSCTCSRRDHRKHSIPLPLSKETPDSRDERSSVRIQHTTCLSLFSF